MGNARAFQDVQRVHVGTQADRRVVATAQHGYHACARETGVYFEPERPKLLRNEGARRLFLECRLRMRVQMAPPGFHLWNQFDNFGGEVHSASHGRQSMMVAKLPARRATVECALPAEFT